MLSIVPGLCLELIQFQLLVANYQNPGKNSPRNSKCPLNEFPNPMSGFQISTRKQLCVTQNCQTILSHVALGNIRQGCDRIWVILPDGLPFFPLHLLPPQRLAVLTRNLWRRHTGFLLADPRRTTPQTFATVLNL